MKTISPWHQEDEHQPLWFNDTYLAGDGHIYASVYQMVEGWMFSVWDERADEPLIEASPRGWKKRETAQKHADKALERCAAKRQLIKTLQGS